MNWYLDNEDKVYYGVKTVSIDRSSEWKVIYKNSTENRYIIKYKDY